MSDLPPCYHLPLNPYRTPFYPSLSFITHAALARTRIRTINGCILTQGVKRGIRRDSMATGGKEQVQDRRGPLPTTGGGSLCIVEGGVVCVRIGLS